MQLKKCTNYQLVKFQFLIIQTDVVGVSFRRWNCKTFSRNVGEAELKKAKLSRYNGFNSTNCRF